MPAPYLAHPEGYAALRIVLVTVPRVSRFCDRFPDGFDLHPLQPDSLIAAGFEPQPSSLLLSSLELSDTRSP